MKTLYDLSWQVDEPTYRQDSALSYSTLARFSREGFSKLDHLFDKITTPSLTFGSAVDCLITGGQEEFDNTFYVTEAKTSESGEAICTNIINIYKSEGERALPALGFVPDEIVNEAAIQAEFWKAEKWNAIRAKKAREIAGIETFYKDLVASQDKIVINQETHQKALDAVEVLKTSENTMFWFAPNNPFDDRIERFYQLKFKNTFNGIEYRGMLDLVLVDHETKRIHPIDLKTSGKPEWEFFKSFLDYSYHIQARLYYRLLKAAIADDPIYNAYKVMDYKFIVVNKDTLTPLVWEYEDTDKDGDLYYGKSRSIECEDPFFIGRRLTKYLTQKPSVPEDIDPLLPNSLTKHLNNLK